MNWKDLFRRQREQHDTAKRQEDARYVVAKDDLEQMRRELKIIEREAQLDRRFLRRRKDDHD